MPAGDFSARSVRSSDEVKSKPGASLLDFDLVRAVVLGRVVISQAQRKREITPFVANANTVSRYFSAGTRLKAPSPRAFRFSTTTCAALPIRAHRKGDAANHNRVFALHFIGERIPVIVLHRRSLVFRALDGRESAVLFDNGNLTKEIVPVASNVGAIFQPARAPQAVWNNRSPA